MPRPFRLPRFWLAHPPLSAPASYLPPGRRAQGPGSEPPISPPRCCPPAPAGAHGEARPLGHSQGLPHGQASWGDARGPGPEHERPGLCLGPRPEPPCVWPGQPWPGAGPVDWGWPWPGVARWTGGGRGRGRARRIDAIPSFLLRVTVGRTLWVTGSDVGTGGAGPDSGLGPRGHAPMDGSATSSAPAAGAGTGEGGAGSSGSTHARPRRQAELMGCDSLMAFGRSVPCVGCAHSRHRHSPARRGGKWQPRTPPRPQVQGPPPATGPGQPQRGR